MKESARELLRNGVKDKLARNEVVLSMTVRLVRTVDIAAIARTAGFDSIYIDVEHSSFSLDTTGQICMAALAAGVTPFVRVPSIASDCISRVLDGVDMLFIGTNDLCSSLGIPGQLDHDLIRKAYVQCLEACRRRGKHLGVGGLSSNPQLAGQFVRLGARYVSTGTDLSFLLGAA